MKTVDNDATETKHHVVIGAEHPVVGPLYFELIPDSEAGPSDIYQLTDTLGRADVFDADWRAWSLPYTHESKRPSYEDLVLAMHIEHIDWHDNTEIQRICQVHGLPVQDLRQWSQDLRRWKDIPVVADLDCTGDDYEAVSLLTV
ncbi:hypothetical protein [Cedecea sp. NFIX57]|uniref:hypothetical protein n=1 Tax=Cedecea sp. NFIX57 TaxID=1566286 RepID=UPI000A0B1BD5|nr:hypothetical protein [Cedecea sp. NFIX57]SMG60317.1 hypothetical protein SAMN03159353_103526 [Cedecea sp. NFIX57]